jgi:glutathione synthase/RimK-type ligase-like ATP-grasp enzyme
MTPSPGSPLRVSVFRDESIGEPSWSERFEAVIRDHGAIVTYFDAGDLPRVLSAPTPDALMWRFTHGPDSQGLAKPFLAAAEHGLGIRVWPDHRTRWHYDDKAAQAWLLSAVGVPTPATTVLTDLDSARAWIRTARFPQVFKLRGGASSQSVCLADSREGALRLVDRAFWRGLSGHHDLSRISAGRRDSMTRVLRALPRDLARAVVHRYRFGDDHVYEPRVKPVWPLERGAVIFQEFLPGNHFDCRVTVIGDRAFACRRFNRPADFRASGSGNLDVDPGQIDVAAIALAFEVSRKLGVQCMAYDLLRDPCGGHRVVEMSYTFVGRVVHMCPGHWDRSLRWHEGPMHPADLIAHGLMDELGKPIA